MSLLQFERAIETRLLGSFLELDQAILDALPIGVCACDGDGQILRVNRYAIELWGRAPKLLDSTQKFCGSFHLESMTGSSSRRAKRPWPGQ